jgi:hypothetical protein
MSVTICFFEMNEILQSRGRIETLILNNYTFGNSGQINQGNTYNTLAHRRELYTYIEQNKKNHPSL